jgi:riboflavin kinase/FMN adenylyltransferase
MSSSDIPVYTTLTEARRATTEPVVPIGNFDGVHIGHRTIFDRARAIAESAATEQTHRPSVIGLTFTPHPVRYFKPDADDFRLMSDPQKFRCMGEHGLDGVMALTFDSDIAGKQPEAFVETILNRGLNASHVVVGSTFRFGKKRAGSTDDLRRLCADHGIGCDVLDEVALDGEIVSSTRIREHLAAGELRAAATLLGRPYTLTGEVVHGAGRGSGLGYPTANIDTDNPVLVPHGIYASRIKWRDTTYPAATSIGIRPTYEDDDAVTVEAFILDAPDNLDLYGDSVELQLDRYLRPELDFESEAALIDQMDDDVHTVRAHYHDSDQ